VPHKKATNVSPNVRNTALEAERSVHGLVSVIVSTHSIVVSVWSRRGHVETGH
jgi:hypothetical protein